MRFSVIGAAGFVARRHVQAIKELGHEVVAIADPASNVGYIDSQFANSEYYNNSEELFYHIPRLGVDYTVVLSPNNLHVPHSISALRAGSHVICEKPLALSAADLDALQTVAAGVGRDVRTILQLRQHPAARAMRECPLNGTRQVRYHTPRGDWFHKTWKGDPRQSGGLVWNIGIHLFDLLCWIYGPLRVVWSDIGPKAAEGALRHARGVIHWELDTTQGPLREFCGHDLSEGFTDAHTVAYSEILAGRGWGIEDARPAIALVSRL